MSRIGPRLRIIRRLGTPLPGLTAKSADNRPQPPGQHGQSTTKRRKISLFRKRLEEKQKIRFHYGISETQLRRVYDFARTRPGRTGDVMLEVLERRLDSVVFRLGFTRTIPAARQMVGHGNIRVNGKRVDRPSYLTSIGDRIEITEHLRDNVHVSAQLTAGPRVALPAWLVIDPDGAHSGRIVAAPTRLSIPFIVDDAAVVEYYAR